MHFFQHNKLQESSFLAYVSSNVAFAADDTRVPCAVAMCHHTQLLPAITLPACPPLPCESTL